MLTIDFLSGEMDYRRRRASVRSEALARALGLQKKNMKNAVIIDATAGLARDSFILASLGFKVILLERSPEIHALLADAMMRAKSDVEVVKIIERMELIHADAISWLQKIPSKPDIIYLDPMFEARKKSALAKKEMRIFHEIVGDDTDADQLLHAALACAALRVVVKRPRLAEPLLGPLPSFSLKGSSSRFDVYLTRELNGNSALTR